jgi:hypothetical protein
LQRLERGRNRPELDSILGSAGSLALANKHSPSEPGQGSDRAQPGVEQSGQAMHLIEDHPAFRRQRAQLGGERRGIG